MKAKIGDKIRIIRMDGEPDYTDKTGIIEKIDNAGQIYGSWGRCAVIPEWDQFEIIERIDNK